MAKQYTNEYIPAKKVASGTEKTSATQSRKMYTNALVDSKGNVIKPEQKYSGVIYPDYVSYSASTTPTERTVAPTRNAASVPNAGPGTGGVDRQTGRAVQGIKYDLSEAENRRDALLEQAEWGYDNIDVKELSRYQSQINELERELDAEKHEEYENKLVNGYREASLKDITVNAFKQGINNSIYGEESFKKLSGRENEAEKYEDILEGEDYRFTTDNWLKEGISGGASLLGQRARQWTSPRSVNYGLSAATIAAIAGNAGPQALVPEEIISVPAAAIAGINAGSTVSNFEIEAGLAYNEMLENGVSEETAKKIALAVGAANAGLEYVQTDKLIKSFNVLKNTGATKSVAKLIGEQLAKRGIDVLNETAQEVAQEVVTIGGAQLGNYIDKGQWAYTSGEVKDRLLDTAKSSALAFGASNVPGAVFNVATGAKGNNQTRTNSDFSDNTQQEQTVTDAVSVDPQVQKPEVLSSVVQRAAELGRVSNSMVEEIMGDKTSLDTLGVELTSSMTQSERRAEVKHAIESIASATETAQEARTGQRGITSSSGQKTVSERSEGLIDAAMSNAVISQGKALGENGKKAFRYANKEGSDQLSYYKGFMAYYNAGVNGESINSIDPRHGSGLSSDQQYAAWASGKNDAKDSLDGEKANATKAKVYSDIPGVKATMQNAAAGFVENSQSMGMPSVEKTYMDKTAKALGLKIVVDESISGGIFNGSIQDGVLRIASDALDPVAVVRTHEFTHRLLELAPEAYRAYRNYVMGFEKDSYAAIEQKKLDYGAQGVTLSNEGAMDEIAADFAGKLWNDSETARQIMKSDRTLGQKIRDVIHNMAQWFRETFGHADPTLERAAKLWNDAFKAAEAQAEKAQKNTASEGRNSAITDISEGTIRFSLKSFKDVVENIENISDEAALKQHRDNPYIFISDNTPKLLREAGAGDHPLIMRFDALYLAARSNGVFKGNYHNLGQAVMLSLPQYLGDPDAILSITNPETGKTRLQVLIGIPVKTGEALASVEINTVKNIDDNYEYYNVVVTAFDLKKRYVKSLFEKNGAVIKYEKEALPQVNPQLHEWLGIVNVQASTNIISGPDENINKNFSLKKSLESGEEGRRNIDARLEEYIRKYGEIEPGENPSREVHLPQKTDKYKKVSQTVRTVLEAEATPDEAMPLIEELVAKGDFSYEAYSDKEAIADAQSIIQDKSYNTALLDWGNEVGQGKVSKENTAMGWALYNAAASEGDMKTAMNVLMKMVGHQRSAAQALQATRILKKLSPDAQLYGVQRSVSNLQEELCSRYGKKAPNLKIDEEMAKAVLEAETQEARDDAMSAIYRDIGRQVPSNFRDKWNAWRYMAMLANPRTHIRNVAGNAGFAPVVAIKNLTGTAIEDIVSRVSGGRIDRTKDFGKGFGKLLDSAWRDYSAIRDEALGGGKYNDSAVGNQYIQEGRKIFGSKTLEGIRKGNSTLLDAEDVWFSRPHYAFALAQYCKANGISAEDIDKGKVSGKARAYAVKEAQKATYRDTNSFSQAVSGLGRYSGDSKIKQFGSVALEGILPFRKTPANILVRGLEYSPVGLTKALFFDLYNVKAGKISAAEAIDNISAGLTGTGLMALGVYMAAQALVRGAGDDDDKERDYEELQGHQTYSLELPGGTSVTLDWLAPEALPFFVGVNLYEQTGGEKEAASMSELLRAISTVTEPLLEMSCLQSLNDIFDAVGYAASDDTSALTSALASAATSYLTQALPTVLGQAERTGERVRMTTYTEKDNRWLTPDMQYTLGRASSRIPGIEYNQIPYIDAWGRTESSGGVTGRAINNFLNPSYTSDITSSEMESELQRLYEVTGEGALLPQRAKKYFTVNKERKDLTAEEYVKYAAEKGQTSYSVMTRLTESEEYALMDDAGRIEAIGLVYEYANAVAKKKVSAYQPDGWVDKAISAESTFKVSPEKYICLYVTQKEIESLKDKAGTTINSSRDLQVMESVYETKGLNEGQRKALFEAFGVGKSVRHFNKALVSSKLTEMRKQAN